ncbi:MAG TPA: AAA family ATPase [Alphaproteobacteria bacterium]|nr:AAA family ATPase [Alphaproteobacteria bacterium]
MDVGLWLRGIGLEQYERTFVENAVDEGLLPKLTADDLKEMGIVLVGHRRKLLSAIAELGERDHAGRRSSSSPSKSPPFAAGAERRQVTVLFADLAGSTRLSTQLDPEEMREVIALFQSCCAKVVARFDGYLAKFMGDGALAYFGWPIAREDDTVRAISTGLELAGEIASLGTTNGRDLAARIGIETGLVVVGDLVGEGAAQESAIVGETPNFAARIQSLAEPGTVTIGPNAHKLAARAFVYQDLGARLLAGVDKPVPLYRVVRPSQAATRFETLRSARLTPLVGREEEFQVLLRRWDLASRGEGQVVLLSGEPGIGKSRLIQTIRSTVGEQARTTFLLQCSPHRADRPFHPLIEQIQRSAGFAATDDANEKIEKFRHIMEGWGAMAPEDQAVISALLHLPGGERISEIEPDPEERRNRIFATVLRLLEHQAKRGNAICVFEDMHWSDPSTRELLDRLVERAVDWPVLVLASGRPEFTAPWVDTAHCTLLSLRRVSERDAVTLIARVAEDRPLPETAVLQIQAMADGIPLFIEELTRAVIDTDGGHSVTADTERSRLAIPATLQESLMARLDRLPGAREVAQLGAVFGRSFDFKLLAAVSGADEQALTSALGQLEGAGLLIRRGHPSHATYSFKHALIQEAAYSSLLRSVRRGYHKRIAAALEQTTTDKAGVAPELLAHHFVEGGAPEAAIRYLREAGENAVEASAFSEAIGNFGRALQLLESLPESAERAREEIAIRLALGGAQIQRHGPASSEMEQSYQRARELCRDHGTRVQTFTALWGSWFGKYQKGELGLAQEFAEQLLVLATELGDTALLLEAHHVQWGGLCLAGEFHRALTHTESGMALYDPAQHHRLTFIYGGHNPGLCARNLNAVILGLVGRPDAGRRSCITALEMARELGHPYTLLEGLFNALTVDMLTREVEAVEPRLAAIESLIESGKVPRETIGLVAGFRGWALCEQKALHRGVGLLLKGCAAWRALFGAWCYPLDGALAEALGAAGRTEEGLGHVQGTLDAANRGGCQWWNAELLRIRASLHRVAGSPAESEEDLTQALAKARLQGASWFELRAARDLARLCADRGNMLKAVDLLTPVCAGFQEGQEAPDLAEARLLLNQLR